MRLFLLFTLALTPFCYGNQFEALDEYILSDDSRIAMMDEVVAGTSQSIWIGCKKNVYKDLFQSDTLCHLVDKRFEGKGYPRRIERLIMLWIIGKPEHGDVTLKNGNYVWGISRIEAEAIKIGFPKEDQEWKVWWQKVAGRDELLMKARARILESRSEEHPHNSPHQGQPDE